MANGGCAHAILVLLMVTATPAHARGDESVASSPEDVPSLISRLSSPDPEVRAAAAWLLADAPERIPEARAALVPLQHDTDRRVRYGVCWALWKLRSREKDRVVLEQDAEKIDCLTYDLAPRPVRIEKPHYPEAAQAKRVEGVVELAILIGEEGEVAHAPLTFKAGWILEPIGRRPVAKDPF
jgi:hypothetical protein